jgi:hypothetical protein
VAKVACLEPRRLLALKTGIMDKKRGLGEYGGGIYDD